MITRAYDNLIGQRQADVETVTAAAADALAAIAAAMETGEEHGPPELYASYAFLQQAAVEALTELRAHPKAAVHEALDVDAPDFAEVSKLGGLVCEVLLDAAMRISGSRQLDLLKAAAHAARIRDLLAS
ncbi:hypothetical protein [Microbispora sp. NPDC049125]|uniref:hypothetical protein n=1 Tax=Microbispora sp. NPDC049125 TaxID=3154929 RepID=UPI0034659614